MHVAHAVCDAEEYFFYLQGFYERFTCISAAIFMSRYDYQFLRHDAKGRGPGLNVITTLIKKKLKKNNNNSLEVSP